MKVYTISKFSSLKKSANRTSSWVYIELPKNIEEICENFWDKIEEDDLFKEEADNGIETEPHVTVKYALLNEDVKEIRDVLKGERNGFVELVDTALFPADEYEVLKITVNSEDLDRIHEKLNRLPHQDRFHIYNPHITLAYLKKGRGKKYVGKLNNNKTFEFSELYFENSNKTYKISLEK